MSRPTLLLLPGLLCDRAVWAPQIEALGAQAEIVVPEYHAERSLEAMACRALEAAGDTPRFAVAGHSMGGRVALEVWRLARWRVDRLALLDTGAHPLAPGEAGERERAGRFALLEAAQREGMRAMAAQWASGMVHASRRGAGAVWDTVLDMFARRTPDDFAAQIEALLARPDAAALLPTIDVPTLFATGADDTWSPPAQHAAMARAVRGAACEVVQGSGHMLPIEEPQALNAALQRWLGSGG